MRGFLVNPMLTIRPSLFKGKPFRQWQMPFYPSLPASTKNEKKLEMPTLHGYQQDGINSRTSLVSTIMLWTEDISWPIR